MTMAKEELDLTDGRVLRAQHNRKQVAQAMLTLLRSGVLQPTRQQVAKQANLSLRSIYHHYDNLEDLHDEVCRMQIQSIRHLVVHPPDVSGNALHHRIVALMDSRAELYEQITPVRRAAMLWIHRSPILLERIAQISEMIRQQLVATFEPELISLDDLQREQTIDALDASTSWDAWDFMRHRKNYTRERTYRAMTRAMESLLLRNL